MYRRLACVWITLCAMALCGVVSGTASATGLPEPSPGLDLLLLLDRSGSMAQYDPADFAVTGAQLLMQLVGPTDRVGVVTFDAEARTLLPLSEAGDGHHVQDLLSRLPPPTGPWTDLNAALRAALDQFATSAGPGRRQAILLFTDGRPETQKDGLPTGYMNQLQQLATRLAGQSIQLYGVGLGAADSGLLDRLAATTDGKAFVADSPGRVVQFFVEILSRVKERQVVVSLEGTGEQAQPVERFSVPPNTELLTLGGIASGGTPGLVVISPSGQRIEELSGVSITAGDRFRTYRLAHPPPGEWALQVEGKGSWQVQGQVDRLRPPSVPQRPKEGSTQVPRSREPVGWLGLVLAPLLLLGAGEWRWRRLARREENRLGTMGELDLTGRGRRLLLVSGPRFALVAAEAQAEVTARLRPSLWAPLAGLGLGSRTLVVRIEPLPGGRVQINGQKVGDGRLYHDDLVQIGDGAYRYRNQRLVRRPRRDGPTKARAIAG